MVIGQPELRGDKGLPPAMRWLMLPVIIAAGLRVVAHISERFQESPASGSAALGLFSVILLGVAVLFGSASLIGEHLMWYRARHAAGSKELIPMNMTVESYQQAFNITGKPVFLPKKHQGVLVAIRPDCLEIFAGYAKYSAPLMRIPYVEILGMSQERVQLYGGKEPGVVIECTAGPFELGFVRTVFARPFSISRKLAQRRFEEIEAAWRASQESR